MPARHRRLELLGLILGELGKDAAEIAVAFFQNRLGLGLIEAQGQKGRQSAGNRRKG